MDIFNSLHGLLILLFVLVVASGFFSGTETAMMALNRYRLRHLTRQGNKAAQRVSRLLEHPDRLLGVILIGNTFSNMLVSAVTTVIAIRLLGPLGVFPATLFIALIVLIFAEITPKTVAVLNPDRFAYPASWLLSVLLKLVYPLVFCANILSNGFLRLFKIKIKLRELEDLTGEEVRTLVFEATGQLSKGYKRMMLGVLDLGGMTVDDIQVPRNDIVGIDANDSWPEILAQLAHSEHTRLPVYSESIDQVQGMLHLRKALNLAGQGQLDKMSLLSLLEEVYFIPQGTPLNIQLLNFKREKHRIGLVVDEYGDILGLVTLDDILEEIVGEFTTNMSSSYKSIQRQRDGSYLVNGSISIRELNRELHWQLPTDGPKTLSGLIIEYLEIIPTAVVGLRLNGYAVEVVQTEENTIKLVRIWPKQSK